MNNGIKSTSEPEKPQSKTFLKWLGSLNWKNCLIIAILIISLACIGVFASGCSSVKAVSYGDGRVVTTVKQSAADSVSVSVNLTPK